VKSTDPQLEIFKWKFTGLSATLIMLAIWLLPFVAGYMIGQAH